MRDLDLWTLLEAPPHDAGGVAAFCAALRELASQHVSERWPFFARLAGVANHPSRDVRAAVVSALAGAAGYRAIALIVRALSDADAEVRLAAVRALIVSSQGEPSRLAHGLFHRHDDVRLHTLIALGNRRPWYAILLAADDVCRAKLLEAPPDRGPAMSVHALLGFLYDGTLPRPLVQQYVADMAPGDLMDALAHGAARDEAEVARLLTIAAGNHNVLKTLRSQPQSADTIDPVLALFWDATAAGGRSLDAPTTPRARFFDRLCGWSLGGIKPAQLQRVLASLLLRGAEDGWDPAAAELALLIEPRFLAYEWVPAEVRSTAVRAFHRHGPRLSPLDDRAVESLIKLPICRRSDGHLDLWMIGGILRLATGEPYKLLESIFGLKQIVQGFIADPSGSASLFTLGRDPDGRARILAAIADISGYSGGAILAGLVLISAADELAFLDSLSPAEWLGVYAALIPMTATSRLSDSKTRRLSEEICRHVQPTLLEEFLSTTADLATGGDSPALLTRTLSAVARAAGADRMSFSIRKLHVTPKRKLLEVIPHCAGFPYGVEMKLALDLKRHADPDIAAWCATRLPKAIAVPGAALPNVTVIDIDPRVADKIAICATAALGAAIEPCISAPTRGVCAALARRSPPGMHSIRTCAALLGCHDPIEQVIEQFAIYSSDDAEFLKKLDAAVVKQWAFNKHLPLLGNCWLHLWDTHCFAAGDVLRAWEGGLVGALEWADRLPVVLRMQVYQTVARLLAMWRWRHRPRFAEIPHAALADHLLKSLATDVGLPAAKSLLMLVESGIVAELMTALKPQVLALLPSLTTEQREVLRPWVDGRGLTTSTGPKAVIAADPDVLRRIAVSDDLDELEGFCRRESSQEVQDAALRLLEHGEKGAQRLAVLLTSDPTPPLATTLAESIPLWPDGPAVRAVLKHFASATGSSEELFAIGAALLERAAIDAAAVLELCRREVLPAWFRPEHWKRLRRLVPDVLELSVSLAASPQPHAYQLAVRHLLESHPEPVRPRIIAALREFLYGGTERLAALRLSVAARLRDFGDFTGWPLLMASTLSTRDKAYAADQFLVGVPGDLVLETADAALLAGPQLAQELPLAEMLNERGVDREAGDDARVAMLRDCALDNTRAEVVAGLRPTTSRAAKVSRLAKSFAWGVITGRELTGRVFSVEMNAGKGLGYTRLESSKVWISPMPILRGERHADEITRGLIVHEFGHHMYHRDAESLAIWKKATDAGYHGLLNLVSDEHLERNLRVVDDRFGDDLKKLGAYAFQHADKEIQLDALLTMLQSRAVSVLTRTKLEPGRQRGCVRVNSGGILAAMERAGMSFPRFVRAMRMGLGNRTGDPVVAEALALFKGTSFRKLTMSGLDAIALKLRELFGWQTLLVEDFGQDAVLVPGSGEVLADGEGISPDEVGDAVRRILDEGKRKRTARGKGSLTLNRSEEESFTPITRVEPVAFDPDKHTAYASQVALSARQMRRYLSQLGVQLVPQRFRVQGHRVDRTRVASAGLLRGDPRLLVSRQKRFETDLFIGLIIDCSGSMSVSNRIEQAKLFGTLLAEASRGVRGIETRVFGFTDDVIYDAGDADRCAAHNLESGGSNNDAAALWHVANVARASRRRARLLVMISDGLPTECSVAALTALVARLTHRHGMCCAQVAVCPLTVRCFPHYVELREDDLTESVRQFGQIIARLVHKAIRMG